jgi:hypothetical protein
MTETLEQKVKRIETTAVQHSENLAKELHDLTPQERKEVVKRINADAKKDHSHSLPTLTLFDGGDNELKASVVKNNAGVRIEQKFDEKSNQRVSMDQTDAGKNKLHVDYENGKQKTMSFKDDMGNHVVHYGVDGKRQTEDIDDNKKGWHKHIDYKNDRGTHERVVLDHDKRIKSIDFNLDKGGHITTTRQLNTDGSVLDIRYAPGNDIDIVYEHLTPAKKK